MIDFWRASGAGRILVSNTVAMLEELLQLRANERTCAVLLADVEAKLSKLENIVGSVFLRENR